MTQTPRYFNSRKIRLIIAAFAGLFAAICLGIWSAKRHLAIIIDWSFLLPFAGFIAAAISFGMPILDWVSKRHAVIDEKHESFDARADALDARANALEGKIRHLENLLERSAAEREDLLGRIIRHEITYKAFIKK
jgi:hypothetical protein